MKIQNKCRDVGKKHLNKRCISNTSLQKGFTLVELIVVITILAILGTIAFISFQGYSRDARDAQRMTALANMKKVLNLYITTNSEYPEPTGGEEVTYSGSEVWTQGTFGDSVRAKLGNRANLSETPYDPLTYNEYTYSVLNTKREYQIAVVFEGEVAYNSPIKNINKVQAAGAYGFTRVAGDYNGKVAKTKSGTTIYVLAVPTIINGDKTLTDVIDIINNKKLVFDKSKILPASYRGTMNFQELLPTGNIINTGSIVAYQTTDLTELQSESNQQVFIENLKNAYSNTVLVENNVTIKEIIEKPTLYAAQTIIHNEITPTVKVTASNTSSSGPNYSDCMSMTDDNMNNLNNVIDGGPYTKEELCDITKFVSSGSPAIQDLPIEIGFLNKVEYIEARTRDLYEIPNTIEYLTELDYFNLEASNLEKIPAELSNLHNLTYLRFDDTQLGDLFSSSFDENSDRKCGDNIPEDGKRMCIEGNGTTIDITIEDM